jgi:pyruvate carboxylase
MREQVPDVPFQMLLRGANGVGYTSYPDNAVHKFCQLAVDNGMDVFRIFDSLNYIENMRLGIDAVGSAGGIVEAAIGYTGDVLRDEPGYKYSLDYYLEQARHLEECGIHSLCIKDMAGLLKPRAATLLIGSLRSEFPNLPIHVHTHDTAGTGVASMLACAEAGADVVDVATDAMSGLTSQPSMGAIVSALQGTKLDTGVDIGEMSSVNDYWEQCRALYAPFESGQKSGSPDVYQHEIPGGQYTNLLFQSTQLGLREKWPEIKSKYADANDICGDIVKVTPSSKVVGDLAQYMTQNDLSKQDVYDQAEEGTLSLPGSVLEYFQGYLGIPHGGFPEPLRTQLLRGKTGFVGRPGAEMEPYDFNAASAMLEERDGVKPSETDLMSHVMWVQQRQLFFSFLLFFSLFFLFFFLTQFCLGVQSCIPF